MIRSRCIKFLIYVVIGILSVFLILNTFVPRTEIRYFNDGLYNDIPPPEKRPWYMKGGTVNPTNEFHSIDNTHGKMSKDIFPEENPNHDRIPEQLMLASYNHSMVFEYFTHFMYCCISSFKCKSFVTF